MSALDTASTSSRLDRWAAALLLLSTALAYAHSVASADPAAPPELPRSVLVMEVQRGSERVVLEATGESAECFDALWTRSRTSAVTLRISNQDLHGREETLALEQYRRASPYVPEPEVRRDARTCDGPKLRFLASGLRRP